jgi:hypothetical protein
MTSILQVFFLLLLLVKSGSSLEIPSVVLSRLTKSSSHENDIDAFYTWKDNLKIHYVKTGDTGPILLLLPGIISCLYNRQNVSLYSLQTKNYSCRVINLINNYRIRLLID